MITVVHALTDRNVGGAGMLLRMLLRHTDKTRLAVHLFLPRGAALAPLCAAEGICCTEIDGVPRTPFSFSALLSALRAVRPDVLFAHAAPTAKVAARLCRVRAVVGVRHCDTPLPRLLGLYRLLTDLTVATSYDCGTRLADAALRYTVIENGYEPISPPSAAERERARVALGVGKEELAVGIVGRLAKVKNQSLAVRALSLCRERMPYMRLHLLGEGDTREELLATARALRISDRVVLHGFRADPAEFYRAMDAHLSCSVASETASLALAEGMSAGCITLASAISGNLRRVGDGGLFFSPTDAEALADRLLLLRHPEARERLKAAALLRASRIPDAAAMSAAYGRLCEAICRMP